MNKNKKIENGKIYQNRYFLREKILLKSSKKSRLVFMFGTSAKIWDLMNIYRLHRI